ncbi:GspH/FimT family pseudopilin [Desulfomicrobium escambiense]|uniref:GspH/FimT family pseudopilin n=1 Tax=Desulfomicrobium escambiense TaxID=29503 RepID=UPI0012ECAA4C|nr:GspH/FimT family pseudopilin [Desulfomicrobium escambiense]
MSTLIIKESVMITKKNTPATSQGFSLVELLVIVAIIAILAGLSGLALMKWIPQANLKRAARTIVSMCQDARIEAIKRNQPVSLNCTQNENSCIVRLDDGTIYRQFNLSSLQSNVHLTGSLITTFNSRGRASVADSLPIKNNAEKTLTITVRSSGSIVTN